MNAVEKKIENQVQFWALLAPFLILLSAAILLFKVSLHWYFPLSALIGIPLCVKWKMKGMAAALAILCFFLAINFQNFDLDEGYWHVGMAMAMAFSFIILTLSLEEVQSLIQKSQAESQSRLDNFLSLDQQFKLAEASWLAEKNEWVERSQVLCQEMAKVKDEKQTFFKIAQLSKDELIQVRGQHELLIQDLYYKKQQIAQLCEQLHESEMTVQTFVNSDSERLIQDYADKLIASELSRDSLQTEVLKITEEKSLLNLKGQELLKNFHASQKREQELIAVQCRRSVVDQHEHEAILTESKNEIQALKEEMTDLINKNKVFEEICKTEKHMHQCTLEKLDAIQKSRENLNSLFGNKRAGDAMYLQLKEQFQEKSRTLDETRRELFYAQEALCALQKDIEEQNIYGKSQEETLLENDLLASIAFYENQDKQKQIELKQLNELVAHLIKQ